MIIGYARTSTKHQEAGLEEQIQRLQSNNCEKIFSEQVSSMTQRNELHKAIEFAREGDTLIVTKLDRLARSVEDFMTIANQLKEKGVKLKIIDFGLDTSTPTGAMILNVMASIAQFERDIMLERQRAGIEKAKSEGKFKGKPRNLEMLKRIDKELEYFDSKSPTSLTITQIANKLGVCTTTIYKRIREICPEKIRSRLTKKQIIEQAFDGNEKNYIKTQMFNQRKRQLKCTNITI